MGCKEILDECYSRCESCLGPEKTDRTVQNYLDEIYNSGETAK
jgi:hypothetical protein